MQITDVVLGLAAGIGIDLSPSGKEAYYVEWSIGELARVDVATGMVTTIKKGLSYPEDVEVDWHTSEIFVSERTGTITRVWSQEKSDTIATPGGAPQQLDLKQNQSGRRCLYTVCYDSGQLLCIDVDAKTTTTIATGLGHPVGLVIDVAQKYAYVTEQDKRALTRVNLGDGSATQLYAGLVSPFFLAWDKDATGIYCVQRDPANSLVRLVLGSPGSPVTAQSVANGLSWRPSGVAPTADNTLIYICADREIEVISFNGGPIIKLPKPDFEVYSVQFNYDKSTAIRLKDHKTGAAIPSPEYVAGAAPAGRNEPAAFVMGTLPHIKVVLKKRAGFTGGAYAIGATGSLGGVRRKVVTPVFNASGLSDPIDLELMWPLPHTIGKPDVTLDWYARKVANLSVPVAVGSASHRLYLVLSKPTEPWVSEIPWIDALEIACRWAAGATTADAAATRITEHYYNSGRVTYDVAGGGDNNYVTHDNTAFQLSQMIDRLNGFDPLEEAVNCTDSAATVSTLANLVGCDLWQSRMVGPFDLNPILAIGFPPPDPWPQWPQFNYHEVAWKGACTENDNLFDGCLMVDGDNDPSKAPHTWLLPINILFGDCTAMNYRLRLSPPGPSGCDACMPQPGTHRRRPVF